jgi:signal transduction histidine kinase
VTYAALKPGSYRFEVKAINSDGVESSQPAYVAFTILSPFWLRWWFVLLANIVVLLLIAFGYRYRLNQLVRMERMRTRIATDLHDDIGSSLSRIALFSEVVRAEAARVSPHLVEMAEKIGQNARELLDSVGTLVWSIDPRHDRFDDLETHLKNFAQEMFTLKGIDYSFVNETDAAKLRLPLDARKNILLIFKEAVNNIVKHAKCKHVEIVIREQAKMLTIMIADDGTGIPEDGGTQGHGMTNMKTRASDVGGKLEIRPGAGGGTVVEFILPQGKRE